MPIANCLFTLIDIIYIMRNSWVDKNRRWRITATKLHNKMFDFGYLLNFFVLIKKMDMLKRPRNPFECAVVKDL